LTRLLRELDAGRPASSQLQQPVISPSAVASPATAQNPVPPSNLTAAPVADHAAAPRQGSGQELTIQPDCVVQISIAEDPSLNGSYPVNDIGAVDLGYIGPVILYNKTEKEAAEKISEVLLNRDFVTATVKVRILKASYGKVKVTGSVRQPGLIRVGAGDTISMNDALLRVGGLAPSALGGKVRVYRGGLMSAVPEAGAYEDYALQTEGGQPCVPNVQLGNNDVASVMPPTAGGADGAAQPLGEKEILVLGEVEKPGFYRFEGSEPCSMLHLLFRVGPLPKFANTKAVKVIRRDASGLETEIPVDAARILEVGNPEADVQLENGDRVVIPEKKFSIL
jgi:protein involved in polysaccharide export with SLBB domain